MDGLAIAASLSELKDVLSDAVVRTIYEPQRGMFIFHLFATRPVRLLLSPTEAVIHLTALDLPSPKTPSPFVMLLRKHLRSGKIVRVCQQGWERAVTFDIKCCAAFGSRTIRLVAELVGQHGNLLLLHNDRILATFRPDTRNPVGSSYCPLPSQRKLEPSRLETDAVKEILKQGDPEQMLARRIDGVGRKTAQVILERANGLDTGPLEERIIEAMGFLLSRVERPQAEYRQEDQWAAFFPLTPPGEAMPSFSAALDRELAGKRELKRLHEERKWSQVGLGRAITKREKTANRMREWLQKAKSVDILRQQADLLMLHSTTLTRGMSEARLNDPETDESVTIPLDPRLDPIENAQVLYKRIKRLKRGRPIVERRLRQLEEELTDIKKGKIPEGKALRRTPPRTSAKPPSQPGPTLRVEKILGYTVQIGKDAGQNDDLLRKARPNDLWLHAKGAPGSHVIIRRRGREEIPQNVIRLAACLAARSSKAKGENRVEVSYTPVKYVRKPKGAPAGLVILSQEATLTVDLREEGE